MRKIVVNNKTYHYMVGKDSCVIQLDGDIKKNIVPLSNITLNDYERGRWQGTTDGMIKPRMIDFYIRMCLE
jgi:hypothetical protein